MEVALAQASAAMQTKPPESENQVANICNTCGATPETNKEIDMMNNPIKTENVT